MACVTGLGQQSDVIIMEFARCWKYLGDLGIMARDMVTLLDKDTGNETTRRAQLERISILVGKVSRIEIEDKKIEPKKCNFYNRGFCKRGSDCEFSHNQDLCESYEEFGICESKRCKKRHLYVCKFLKSEHGCIRGKSCEYSHRKEPIVSVEKVSDDVVALGGIKKDRLGEGEFGWVPTRDESVESLKTSGIDCTKDEHKKRN